MSNRLSLKVEPIFIFPQSLLRYCLLITHAIIMLQILNIICGLCRSVPPCRSVCHTAVWHPTPRDTELQFFMYVKSTNPIKQRPAYQQAVLELAVVVVVVFALLVLLAIFLAPKLIPYTLQQMDRFYNFGHYAAAGLAHVRTQTPLGMLTFIYINIW